MRSPGAFGRALGGGGSAEDHPKVGPIFPSVTICSAVEVQAEEDRALLSFRTPALQDLSGKSVHGLYEGSQQDITGRCPVSRGGRVCSLQVPLPKAAGGLAHREAYCRSTAEGDTWGPLLQTDMWDL